MDHVVAAAIAEGGEITYDGIADVDRALEIKRGVYRCGQHRKISVQVTWPYRGTVTSKSSQWPPDKVKGCYQLTIRAFRKSHGRKHVVDTLGPDRTRWHYNPRARIQKG